MGEKAFSPRSEIRKDAWKKVNGGAEYVGDLRIKRMKFCAAVRSPHHLARLVSIDTREAARAQGVLAVITAEDVPGEKVLGDIITDRPVLAMEKVRFMGEPVALVVADSEQLARDACRLVRVQYEPLPAVFDPLSAMEKDAPQVHIPGNLCSEVLIEEGDLDEGFKQAHTILEETFNLPRIYPAYLETEASLAHWQPDNTMTVWVSSQKPFGDRSLISRALGIDEEKVIVKVPAVGGAFGGKEDSSIHMLCALAAWKIRGAVSMVNTREESLLAHPKRHSGRLHYRIGAAKDGTITALELEAHLDTGAYASYGPAVAQLFSEAAAGPYRIANVKINTKLVYTNGPIAGAMRGFGAPQANFALESLMDMVAEKIGVDPIELRRRNIWKAGDRSFTRVLVNQAEALTQALETAETERRRLVLIPPAPGRKSGVGVALLVQTMGLGAGVPDDSTNRLEWLPDGRVVLYLGAPDLGQGLITVGAQMAADALGLDYSRVDVVHVDTSVTPDGGVSCASRMTYSVGNSIILAADKLVENLLEEASLLLKTDRAKLRYEKGKIYNLDHPQDEFVSAAEITSRCAENGVALEGTGVFSFPYSADTPRHLPIGMPHVLFCFGADVARVEVDPELGMVEVTHLTAIHDVGKVVHRAGLEGQIEGGAAMGLGYALYEEMALKPDGNWVDGLSEYLLPTSLDMPALKIIILENPEPSGPHGAKGIGEMGLTPVAAAVANALFCASGIRVKSIPIRPEMIMG